MIVPPCLHICFASFHTEFAEFAGGVPVFVTRSDNDEYKRKELAKRFDNEQLPGRIEMRSLLVFHDKESKSEEMRPVSLFIGK